jgi:hypothetical protein
VPISFGVRRRLAGEFGLLGWVLAWTVPAAAAAVAALHEGFNLSGDSHLFLEFGRTLLSSHWNQAFSSSAVQVGPLQLLLYGSIGRSHVALALFLSVVTALLVVAAARVVGVKNPALLGGVGLLAVVTGLTGIGYGVGHPADPLLPLVWIFAAHEARRGRAWKAGLIIGLCAGMQTWGILGVAVLALVPRVRDAAVGFAIAAGTALVLFLPFMLGGHFAMFSFEWHVFSPSPMSLFVATGTPFGWPLRLVQATVAVAVGATVARLLRQSPHALWAAPLAIVAARLQFDPDLYQYYLAAPQGLILVGAAVGAAGLRWVRSPGGEPAEHAAARG